MAASRPKPDKKPQSQRFIEAAREAECAEDEAVFDENLRRVTEKPATAKPKPDRSRDR